MKFPKLDYPKTNQFTWRYFTPVTIMLFVTLLVIITLVNAVVVGYQTVTVVRGDFNTTQEFWWNRHLGIMKSKPTCDPHQFTIGDTFFTNVSAFPYTILTITATNATTTTTTTDTTDTANTITSASGFPYSAQPLHTICKPMLLVVSVSAAQRSTDGYVTSMCLFSGLNVTILLSYSPVPFVESTPILVETLPVEAPNATYAIENMSEDLVIGVLATSARTPIDTLRASTSTDCYYWGYNSTDDICNLWPTSTSGLAISISCHVAYSNRSYLSITSDIPNNANLSDSLHNYFYTLFAASLVDMGIWNNPESVFASPEKFRAIIRNNSAVTAAAATGQLNPWVNTSEALYMIQAGPEYYIPPKDNKPVVIAMTYVCHDQQIKSPLNFIICQSFVSSPFDTQLTFSLLFSRFCG